MTLSLFAWLLFAKKEQWTSDIISKYFAEDFRLFTAQDFKLANHDDRRKPRNLLRSGCVYPRKGWSIIILDALYAVVKEEIPSLENEIDDESLEKHKTAHCTAKAQVDEPAQLKLFDETKTNSTASSIKKGNLSNLIKA